MIINNTFKEYFKRAYQGRQNDDPDAFQKRAKNLLVYDSLRREHMSICISGAGEIEAHQY